MPASSETPISAAPSSAQPTNRRSKAAPRCLALGGAGMAGRSRAARLQPVHHRRHPILIDVGVNLGRRQIDVPQQRLNVYMTRSLGAILKRDDARRANEVIKIQEVERGRIR